MNTEIEEPVSLAQELAETVKDGRVNNSTKPKPGLTVYQNGQNRFTNQQTIENNPMAQALVEQYASDPDALHNPKAPNLVIQHESPIHRLILLYRSKGMSHREIARQLGKSESWISQVCRQPWFQQRLVHMLAEAGGEIIDQIVRVEATNSIFKLVELRDNAKSESVQADCAKEIIYQLLGKPVQRVQTQSTVVQVAAKLEDLDKELRVVEEEEKRLLHQGSTIESGSPTKS